MPITWYRFHWLIFLIISGLITGCALFNPPAPSANPTNNPETERVTPTLEALGHSREKPFSGKGTISLPNWEVTVLEMVRGNPAWERLQAANQFNDPAPEDWTYILIKYRLHRKGNSRQEGSLGLHLTGNANILHYSFNNSAVSPEPILNSYLVSGQTSEGWDAYLIREDESDLMLVLNDYSDYEQPEYFARLDEKAELTVPDTLAAIKSTAVGMTITDTAPFGQITTSEDWQMSVQQIQQGEEAWLRLYAGNAFNEPPSSGHEYLLVKVWVHYIGTNPLGAPLSAWDFGILNRHQEILGGVTVSGLDNYFPYTKLYPDGQLSGWIPFLVESDDESVVLAFKPNSNSPNGNRRYFSLRASGR